jgi:hypothetical protein
MAQHGNRSKVNIKDWLISTSKLYKIFISVNLAHFIRVLFGQLQLNVAAAILTTMICSSERKQFLSQWPSTRSKQKLQWTILQDHQGSLCTVLPEPLANKFVWRNFVNCKMGKASRSVISIYVYFKLSTAIRSIPSPQLTIVGCEDNIFLTSVVISSTVISSIH